MPVAEHVFRMEPTEDAEIWRFHHFHYFQDLMASEELYFRRADLYKSDDPNEGLPSDDYVRATRGFVRYDLNDELKLNNDQASNRQFSESFYLSCWQLYEGETLAMWKRYGPVAVCTTYGRLKAALHAQLDSIHLGLVRYGDEYARRDNILEFIFSKRVAFEEEREVRAVLCCYDPLAGLNRHFNERNFPSREPLYDVNRPHPWVHGCKRRRIDLKALVTGIVMGPWVTEAQVDEAKLWVKVKRLPCEVKRSEQTGTLTPTPDELSRFGI